MKSLIEQIQEMEVDEETLSLLSDSALIHNTYKLAYKQALTDVLSLIHPYAKYKDDMKNLICYFANPYKIGEGVYSIPYTPVGFIKDLSINCTGETICVVKWNNGETKEIHPSNLISVKAYREQIQNNKE